MYLRMSIKPVLLLTTAFFWSTANLHVKSQNIFNIQEDGNATESTIELRNDINNLTYTEINSQNKNNFMKTKNTALDSVFNDDIQNKENILQKMGTHSSYQKNETNFKENEISLYQSRAIENRNLPPLLIETSSTSELISAPGSHPKIVFEVTNNSDRKVILRFVCRDEKSLLQNLQPRAAFLSPGQTISVTVDTFIPVNKALDFTDLITLTAHGEDKTDKSVILYITRERTTDNELPYVYYRFLSNCADIPSSACQSKTWTTEVTAQDTGSGILQITSNPLGLYSPVGYVSGTKESVLSYYSSTCCQPYLEIIVTDLNNNKRSYKIDAYSNALSAGSISAIILGILLLLVIIIIIIVLIKRRYSRNASLDLPRYRSHLRTERF